MKLVSIDSKMNLVQVWYLVETRENELLRRYDRIIDVIQLFFRLRDFQNS